MPAGVEAPKAAPPPHRQRPVCEAPDLGTAGAFAPLVRADDLRDPKKKRMRQK